MKRANCFGKNIKKIIKKHNLTYEIFGQYVGASKQNVEGYIRNSMPRYDTMLRIIETTGFDYYRLVGTEIPDDEIKMLIKMKGIELNVLNEDVMPYQRRTPLALTETTELEQTLNNLNERISQIEKQLKENIKD